VVVLDQLVELPGLIHPHLLNFECLDLGVGPGLLGPPLPEGATVALDRVDHAREAVGAALDEAVVDQLSYPRRGEPEQGGSLVGGQPEAEDGFGPRLAHAASGATAAVAAEQVDTVAAPNVRSIAQFWVVWQDFSWSGGPGEAASAFSEPGPGGRDLRGRES